MNHIKCAKYPPALFTHACQQNDSVWASGYKTDVDPSRLIFEKEKSERHVMVSAGIQVAGNGRLHFVDDQTKGNADYHVKNLVQNLCQRRYCTDARWFYLMAGWHSSSPRMRRKTRYTPKAMTIAND